MVVLLYLNGDADGECHSTSDDFRSIPKPHISVTIGDPKDRHEHESRVNERHESNPNINGFSAALGCYPIVSQLAHFLDLNTLYALSRTCRQFRANLLQYRKYLVAHSLRCSFDFSPGDGGNFRDIQRVWLALNRASSRIVEAPQRKFAACARDMVSDCRCCGQIVCRNCIYKPPSASTLSKRHRRLCSVCLAAPLYRLIEPPSSIPLGLELEAFTAPAFIRDPCSCSEAVFLCQSCGYGLTSADTTYKRVWTWRTRYSTYLGGLGTGIGEGNEGVQCGRGTQCLAAEDKEVEIDCGSKDFLLAPLTVEKVVVGDLNSDETSDDGDEKPGYMRQEIEGIGGVVKKKVKKRVRVGKTVREHEDERERAEYLQREVRGESRSWCAWCQRVIPGVKDIKLVESTTNIV